MEDFCNYIVQELLGSSVEIVSGVDELGVEESTGICSLGKDYYYHQFIIGYLFQIFILC